MTDDGGYIYVDMDSGTVLNGPIRAITANLLTERTLENMQDSDDTARTVAARVGFQI